MDNLTIFGIKLGEYLTPEAIGMTIRVLVLLVVGIPLIYWVSRWVGRAVSKKYAAHQGMLAGKMIYYTGLTIIVISVLKELGFSLTHLLGAAGIVGIALGFASQTSVSNIISGLFLVTEKPFSVGDIITVGDTTGVVLSIDTLSVKIRKFDNKYVRIPNENIIKSEVTNITRFPIRRVDLNIGVAYKEDIGKVRDVLIEVAHKNPLCLEEPEPLVIFTGYGNSSIDMLFAVWAVKENWLAVKNSLMEEVKKAFEENGIEIPFPHLSLYTGAVTQPFPIQIITPDENVPQAKVEV